ncbi:hypothetical protein [Halostagnicola bangensis]
MERSTIGGQGQRVMKDALSEPQNRRFQPVTPPREAIERIGRTTPSGA